MITSAIIPGSFDPITVGHLDIIRRASLMYDKVIVLVANNPSKNYMFSAEKRVMLVKDAVKDFENVSADFYDGFIVDYIAEHGKPVIVKGIRSDKDFDYEKEMAHANKKLSLERHGFIAETVFIPADEIYSGISSTLVRTHLEKHLLFDAFVPNASLINDIINQ